MNEEHLTFLKSGIILITSIRGSKRIVYLNNLQAIKRSNEYDCYIEFVLRGEESVAFYCKDVTQMDYYYDLIIKEMTRNTEWGQSYDSWIKEGKL